VTRDETQVRIAARAIIIDADDRVLLIRGADPAEPGVARWWYTPGGGVEPGESLVQAVKRELLEEIGLEVDHVGEVVYVDENAMSFDAKFYRQHNSFFMIRVDQFEPDLSDLSAEDRLSILSVEWLTLDDMRAVPLEVYPPTLTDIVASLLAADRAT
jgi:ADP-ribose pyrophosphatase YjhB (NUDIX family)